MVSTKPFIGTCLASRRSLELFPSGQKINFFPVIDIITGKVLQRFENDNRSVWCVDCLPSADIVIGGGDDGEVEVWKISTGERVSQIICDDSIYDINIAANGKEVLVASGVVRKIQ